MASFALFLDGLDWMTALGLAGTATYVLNYSLLASRTINSECLAYFVINTIAASLVLVGLAQSFNLPSTVLQVFWITIGVSAICLRLYRLSRRRTRPAPPERRRLPQAAPLRRPARPKAQSVRRGAIR